MKFLRRIAVWFFNDTLGQDLIEYALLAALVAVSAGALMPDVATSFSKTFSKVDSVLTAAIGGHGRDRGDGGD